MRPKSIVLFERLYLGGWALGVVNTVLTWSAVRANPNMVAVDQQVGSWYVPTLTAIGLAIPLLLWFFIARKASVVAKWIMVVFTALGVLGIAFAGLSGTLVAGLSTLLSVTSVVLNIVAAALLFRADSREWFGEDDEEIAA